jgi:hypothetical protein
MAASGASTVAMRRSSQAAVRPKQRVRVDLALADQTLLQAACLAFGLEPPALIRTLLRASLDAGPALSREGLVALAQISADLRTASRQLGALRVAIGDGPDDGLAALKPVLVILHERLSALDRELTAMTLGHGARLRRAAQLREMTAA